MAKPVQTFVCQSCGAATSKWQGRCDGCGEWNTILEEAPLEAPGFGTGATRGKKATVIQLADLRDKARGAARLLTGIGEFDRTLGGGAVPGTAILVGGDPHQNCTDQLLTALHRSFAHRSHQQDTSCFANRFLRLRLLHLFPI